MLSEHKIIAAVAVRLIKKDKWPIAEISAKKRYHRFIKNKLSQNGIPSNIIRKIRFKTKGKDIIARPKFGTGRTQKEVIIEAKGGTYLYAIYTAIGQMVCSLDTESSYTWFGFAFPLKWKPHIRRYLMKDDKIKPIINNIIKRCSQTKRRVFFYFVDENENVIRETWKQTLS